MSKTDETFQDAIMTLRAWLNFIDVKERDFREQLERARRREREDVAGETTSVDVQSNTTEEDNWM
ncbi:MAG: hypothetical protein N2117_12840 [Anaerolineales bacterium]|nr:hypothetical protein [Anaerolineales bacterium]